MDDMSYQDEQAMKERIGQLSEESRLEQGLSRPALAKKSGVSIKTIQTFELGQTWPQATRLRAITNALGWEARAVEKLLTSGAAPESVTVDDVRGNGWGAAVTRASDLSDEELLSELTMRMQMKNAELRGLKEDRRGEVVQLRPKRFDESLPHAAHPKINLDAHRYPDDLGEETQDPS